jgi:hypothetical protein
MGANVVLRRQGATMLRRAGTHARHFSPWLALAGINARLHVFLFHADDFFNLHCFKNAVFQL